MSEIDQVLEDGLHLSRFPAPDGVSAAPPLELADLSLGQTRLGSGLPDAGAYVLPFVSAVLRRVRVQG